MVILWNMERVRPARALTSPGLKFHDPLSTTGVSVSMSVSTSVSVLTALVARSSEASWRCSLTF